LRIYFSCDIHWVSAKIEAYIFAEKCIQVHSHDRVPLTTIGLGQNNFGPIVHDEECFVTSEAVSVGSVIGMIVAVNSVCFVEISPESTTDVLVRIKFIH
jgi:hypothetical protein